MPLNQTIFAVDVCDFSSHLALLHLHPFVATGFFSLRKLLKRIYFHSPFLPVKSRLQRVLNYYGNITLAGCQISHLHCVCEVCVHMCVYLCPPYCAFTVKRPFIIFFLCCLRVEPHACTLSATCPCWFHPADPRDVILLIHFGGKITQSSCNLRQRHSLDESFSCVGLSFFQAFRQLGCLMGNSSRAVVAAACFPAHV